MGGQYKYPSSSRFPILPIASITNTTTTHRTFSSSKSIMGEVTAIQSFADFKSLIASDKPVVIDFWATWCGPCRVISPIFATLSEKYTNVAFFKVDIDEQPEIAQEVGIRAMPTFVVFKNGEKIDELVGASPPKLEELLVKAN